MRVENLKIYDSKSFEEYLAMPGLSYSGIKQAGKEFTPATIKMSLGTDVHNYLLTPADYHHNNIAIVKPLVQQIKSSLGSLLTHLAPERAFTCDFIHQGFRMKYKGRADLSIYKRIILDLKVTEMKDIPALIKYFGYDRQLSGYAIALGCRAAMIITIHPKTKITQLINIPISTTWWEEQIITKGEPDNE